MNMCTVRYNGDGSVDVVRGKKVVLHTSNIFALLSFLAKNQYSAKIEYAPVHVAVVAPSYGK